VLTSIFEPSAEFTSRRHAKTFCFEDREFLVLLEPVTPFLSLPGLSRSEREVVGLVADGRSNGQIAHERGVRYRTVANQLASVYRKLCVASRHELIAFLHDRKGGFK
jgi:DNA-binding NarL/FixJ family response regulator